MELGTVGRYRMNIIIIVIIIIMIMNSIISIIIIIIITSCVREPCAECGKSLSAPGAGLRGKQIDSDNKL